MKNFKRMFKTGFLLLMVGLMMAPAGGFANASNTFKTQCNFWKKRYKSSTRISLLLVPLCIQTRKGCSTVLSRCEVPSCGVAVASAGPSINFVDELIWGTGCGGGDISTELYSDIHKVRYNDFAVKETNIMQTTFKYENEFDLVNRKFIVKNGNGYLKIDKDYAGYVGLDFKLWESANEKAATSEDEEEIIDPNSLFVQESILVKNNELILSEGLRGNRGIIVEEYADYFVVKLSDFYQEFDIPESVDMDNVSARVSSSAESDNDRIAAEQLADENALDVFPNPSNGDFSVQLSKSIDADVEIKMYNMQGALVKNFGTYQGLHKGERVSINTADLSLPNGSYIISVVGEGIIEIKKIMITRQ